MVHKLQIRNNKNGKYPQFFIDYVHSACSTCMICTFTLLYINSMVKDVGRKSKEGTLNSSGKSASNVHSFFPLIFKWELKNLEWEGL